MSTIEKPIFRSEQPSVGALAPHAEFSRADAALLLVLAALVALFFWRILTPNPLDRAQFPAGDFTDQFYAFRLYQARAFSEGRVPLWSENFNSGHPFLADIQSAVFYPIALGNTVLNLALFKSFSLFALELEALVHFWLAGAFTYLFARRVQRRCSTASLRVGAFVSAIVFTFGGYLTSYPSLQLAILETAAWLPLALYCIERAIEDRGRTTDDENAVSNAKRYTAWLIAAGMVLGVAALAGHPQTFLFVIATSVIYFLFRVWQSHPDSKIENANRNRFEKSKIVFRAFGAIAFLALIAFGIAAIQLVPAIEYQQLSTREALSFAEAAKGFPTLDLLQFILPGYASAFASPLYVGILPLWLAIFALAGRQRTKDEKRTRVFWGLLALGSLILSFGFYVFAYVIFYLFVPGASLFRQQERLAFVVSFALAMLAGYGITDLLRRIGADAFDVKRAKKMFALLLAGTVIMLALLLVFYIAGTQSTEGRIAFLGDRAGLLLIQFGLASLLVGLYLKNVLNVRWFALLAMVLILFDLWSVNEPANKGRVQDRFADIPFTQTLQNDANLFRIAVDKQLLPGHFGLVTGLQDIDGISPLRLARYDKLMHLANAYEWLNVGYLMTKQPQSSNGKIVSQEGEIALVSVQNAKPRAWITNDAMLEQDDTRALELLDKREWSHIPLSKVSIPDRQAEYMTLDLFTPEDGTLVISENFYPGWHATIDGQPTEILRANLTLRAIPVRAGQHHIEMWYDPLSFKLGAAISIVTLFACIGALIYFSGTGKMNQDLRYAIRDR